MKKGNVNVLFFSLFAVMVCNNSKASEEEAHEQNIQESRTAEEQKEFDFKITVLKDTKNNLSLLGEDILPLFQKLINSNGSAESLKEYREGYFFSWLSLPEKKRPPIILGKKKFDKSVKTEIDLIKESFSQKEWENFSNQLNEASEMGDLENIIDNVIDSIKKQNESYRPRKKSKR